MLIFGHNVFVRIQIIFMSNCMPFNVIDKLPYPNIFFAIFVIAFVKPTLIQPLALKCHIFCP